MISIVFFYFNINHTNMFWIIFFNSIIIIIIVVIVIIFIFIYSIKN